jgi:hypothetical protein
VIAGGAVVLALMICIVCVCITKEKKQDDYDAVGGSSQMTSSTDGPGMQRTPF